ncbi:hypothetical protein ACOBR2_06465 [Telmatobacter bradus]|uniref:hypothetical protein n=1 Tax=Telmatobacter bradus TaxID=474953 RepID=UPI003B43D521
MSVFVTIIKDTETDLAKVEKVFVKIFKKSPTWLGLVDSFVVATAPEIEAVVLVVDPTAEPEVAAILKAIETALATAKAAATDLADATTAKAALDALKADLPELLATAQVKNSTLTATIEKVADKAIASVEVLIDAYEAATSSTSTAAA